MAGRRILNEQDARRCLAAAKSSQAGVAAWSRAHGVDGRYFAIEMTDAAYRNMLTPLRGGRGIAGVSLYFMHDIRVTKIQQNEWFKKSNRGKFRMRQMSCGVV
jgi:hypothetical protein